MPPRLRKVVLTIHVATSVGWLGAVLSYLVLDVTATTGRNVSAVRAAYAGMELIALYAIVPLALVSVLVGVVNALGTPWGLLRHYWVVAKLLLTLTAATVLLIETGTISWLADAAADSADPRELPGTLLHSIGGAAVLLTTTILSVVKPRGLTRYGWRRQNRRRAGGAASATG